MSEKRDVGMTLETLLFAVAVVMMLGAIQAHLDRIADALERAYPAQEDKP